MAIFGFLGPKKLRLDTTIMILSRMITKLQAIVADIRYHSGGHLAFHEYLKGQSSFRDHIWIPWP